MPLRSWPRALAWALAYYGIRAAPSLPRPLGEGWGEGTIRGEATLHRLGWLVSAHDRYPGPDCFLLASVGHKCNTRKCTALQGSADATAEAPETVSAMTISSAKGYVIGC